MRNKIRHSLFPYNENETKSLSPNSSGILVAQRRDAADSKRLVLENTNSSAPKKTSTCQAVHNS